MPSIAREVRAARVKRSAGLYKLGQNTKEIAEALGCCRSSVYGYLRSAGYTFKNDCREAHVGLRRRTLKRLTIARSMRSEGADWRQIGAALNVTKTTVYDLLSRTR